MKKFNILILLAFLSSQVAGAQTSIECESANEEEGLCLVLPEESEKAVQTVQTSSVAVAPQSPIEMLKPSDLATAELDTVVEDRKVALPRASVPNLQLSKTNEKLREIELFLDVNTSTGGKGNFTVGSAEDKKVQQNNTRRH